MASGRIRLVVQGQVQGVGFRPFVFTLAEEHALTGLVRNSPRGVVIEVQGDPASLDAFAADLERRLPMLARITSLSRESLDILPEERSFTITASTSGSTHAVLISPDTCTCPDCLADIADPDNRRYRYPFTNCTNCGPATPSPAPFPTTAPRPAWPASRFARTAWPSTTTRATAVSTPSPTPARSAARGCGL